MLELGDRLRRLDRETGMSIADEKSKYDNDLRFAIGMYSILRDDFGITDIEASDDGIWRYIQMDLIPDVIYLRWPGVDQGINEDRMWRNGRRIWLKTLWWYIHLSRQNSIEETYEILKSNSSDDISQLIERTGIGYRCDLYREIMRQYAEHDHSGHLLRRVLKLNVAICGSVEPLLCNDGLRGYVAFLYDQLEEKR